MRHLGRSKFHESIARAQAKAKKAKKPKAGLKEVVKKLVGKGEDEKPKAVKKEEAPKKEADKEE